VRIFEGENLNHK